MLRMPDGMRKTISKVAKENNRSMNAEIVARLQETFSLSHMPARADGKHLEFIDDMDWDKLRATITEANTELLKELVENQKPGEG